MLIDKQTLDNYPPFLVRALAREDGAALTMRQIAAKSGLPLRTVCRIAARLSWDGVKHEKVYAFCVGCNFNLKSTKKVNNFLKKQVSQNVKFGFLSPIQRRTLDRKLAEWLKLDR
jgi:hypothetical protein